MVRFYQPTNAAALLNSVCQPCLYSCLTCDHSTLCLTCNTTNNTRYFSNGQCLCNTGFYDNSSYILCLPCHYTCLTCVSSAACTSCNPLNNRIYNSTTGYCSCLRGYYDIGDGISSVCLKCDSSCYTCTNSTSCANCYPLTNKYINSSMGTNYCVCYYGYYLISSTNVCNQCHYSCE